MKNIIPTFEQFLFEAEDVLKTNIGTFKYKTLKNKRSQKRNPTFHLLLTDLKTKEIIVFPDFFWYEEGWSQGMGRSEHGYYLNMKFYGGVGNGSGRPSPGTPWVTYDMQEALVKFLNGKHYNKDKQKEFDEIKKENVFPKGTKMAEISNNYDW